VNVCTVIVVARECWSSYGCALEIEIMLNHLGMFWATSGTSFGGLGIVLEPFRFFGHTFGHSLGVKNVTVAPMVPLERPKALIPDISSPFSRPFGCKFSEIYIFLQREMCT